MKLIFAILKGMVIGLANIIPGVSGGTMMVSMGIYDTLIYCITHLFKEFKKCVLTLLPYAIGIVVALVGLSFIITTALDKFALPTNMLFIGLIFGGLPAILSQIRGEKKGVPGILLFLLFAAFIILLEVIRAENTVEVKLSALEVIKLFVMGVIASATMVVPGVSGSMMLMLFGYYHPVVDSVKNLTTALVSLDMSAILGNVGILLPFGIGIVVGIFAIAKAIELLLAKWKGLTYCAILGLVAASPVAILMGLDYSGIGVWTVLVSIVTFAAGFAIAWALCKKEKETA